MLDDLLDFAALSLVENGTLSIWMPTSNDLDEEILPPAHPCLAVSSICTQAFNKCKYDKCDVSSCTKACLGSRRLITYRRLPDSDVVGLEERIRVAPTIGKTADQLNPFRKRYFEAFKT